MARAFGYGFCAACYDYFTRVGIWFRQPQLNALYCYYRKFNGVKINPATRGAPTAGSSFHYDPVYDGISTSLQQA